MRALSWMALGATALSLLVACGHGAPSGAPASPAPRPTRPSPTPTPSLLPAPAVDPALEATGRQRVATAIARLDTLKTITGRVRFEEWKDSQHDLGEAKVAFLMKPFKARVDVEISNRLLAKGTTILWNGGSELKVKPLGLPFGVTFRYDHPQVVSLRGYRLDQTDIFSMGKVLRHPGARIKPLGPRRLNNEDYFMVEVRSPASVKDAEHELIGLNLRHQIPTYREVYDARQQLIHRGLGMGLRLDGSVDQGQFD